MSDDSYQMVYFMYDGKDERDTSTTSPETNHFTLNTLSALPTH